MAVPSSQRWLAGVMRGSLQPWHGLLRAERHDGGSQERDAAGQGSDVGEADSWARRLGVMPRAKARGRWAPECKGGRDFCAKRTRNDLLGHWYKMQPQVQHLRSELPLVSHTTV